MARQDGLHAPDDDAPASPEVDSAASPADAEGAQDAERARDAELPQDPSSQTVLDLLAEGVPMALVADLVDPAGPASPVILEEEGLPEQAWWERDLEAPGEDEGAPDAGSTPSSPQGDA